MDASLVRLQVRQAPCSRRTLDGSAPGGPQHIDKFRAEANHGRPYVCAASAYVKNAQITRTRDPDQSPAWTFSITPDHRSESPESENPEQCLPSSILRHFNLQQAVLRPWCPVWLTMRATETRNGTILRSTPTAAGQSRR